jgi:hypothetical protein
MSDEIENLRDEVKRLRDLISSKEAQAQPREYDLERSIGRLEGFQESTLVRLARIETLLDGLTLSRSPEAQGPLDSKIPLPRQKERSSGAPPHGAGA